MGRCLSWESNGDAGVWGPRDGGLNIWIKMEHIIARIHWIRYLKLEEQEWSLGAAVSSSLFPGLQGGCIFYIIEDYLRCYFETWIVWELQQYKPKEILDGCLNFHCRSYIRPSDSRLACEGCIIKSSARWVNAHPSRSRELDNSCGGNIESLRSFFNPIGWIFSIFQQSVLWW